jgi:uncharacterized protein
MPDGEPSATVLMHPGSGLSDRDNDVFFPPIREHLLGAGIAVSSFDKRGVGDSTGSWHEAAIGEQAADAMACLEALRAGSSAGGRVGLYGHSQGGWVVVEAAAHSREVAFVVTSSGPGVTPAQQERYASHTYLTGADIGESEIDEVGRYYDRVFSLMRAGASLDDARKLLETDGFPTAFATLSLPVLPEDEREWRLFAAMIDYDPRSALERIEVPILALFGAADRITPVEDSVAVFRESVHPDLLQVEVFDGADHRLQAGSPPAFVDDYLEALTSFILRAGLRELRGTGSPA